jgi:hypothetical protein
MPAQPTPQESKLMPLLPRKCELPRLVQQPWLFARAYWLPLTMLFIGAAANLITTYRNLRLYGPQVAAHPVQRWVSQLVGVSAGVAIAKVIQLAFVLLVAAWWRPWTGWLLALCGLLYTAAAVSNYFLLL